MASNPPLTVTADEHSELKRWVRAPSTPQALALRCRIVLACARGLDNAAVAREHGVSVQTVAKWRTRFEQGRLASLRDRSRSGAPRRITDVQAEQVLEITFTEAPPNGVRWTKRAMATRLGLSASSVTRIWRHGGIPTTGPAGARVSCWEQWIGLYSAPPESIMVLAVESTRVPGPQSFRAIDVAAPCEHAELRRRVLDVLSRAPAGKATPGLAAFLRDVQRRRRPEEEIHLICHGHSARRTEAIRRWQESREPFHVHFSPNKDFWLRLVERHVDALIGTGNALTTISRPVLGSARRDGTPDNSFTWYLP